MAVKNRLIELMGAKQEAEGRVINASTVARETGLTRQVIAKWMRGEVVEFRADMVEQLCRYFKCGIDDLLEIIPDPREAMPN
jgi:DNA-binding Xre family transcriptional regulator